MLAIVASYDGQSSVAIQAGKDYSEMMNNMYHVLTLVRFGRFNDILAIGDRPSDEGGAGIWDFAQGYARLRQGELDSAQNYLDRVMESAAASDGRFRFHSAENLLGILGSILKGEIRHGCSHHLFRPCCFH